MSDPQPVGTPAAVPLRDAVNVFLPRNADGTINYNSQQRFTQALARTVLRTRQSNQAADLNKTVDLPAYRYDLNVNGTTGIPPVIVVGGSAREIELVNIALGSVVNNANFNNFLKSIGVGLPRADGTMALRDLRQDCGDRSIRGAGQIEHDRRRAPQIVATPRASTVALASGRYRAAAQRVPAMGSWKMINDRARCRPAQGKSYAW